MCQSIVVETLEITGPFAAGHQRGPFCISTQNLKEPWWVLPAEMVHGMTFAITWSATTDYAHQIAPGALGLIRDRTLLSRASW